MILQSAQHLTNPNGFAIDPALGPQLHSGLPYPNDDQFRSHTPQSQPPIGFTRFDSAGSQLGDQALSDRMNDTPDPEADGNDGRKSQKNRSSASAQNDIELRRLFREAEHSSLQEVALQLQGNERGPQSEKIRQTFAMIW
jgi:regulatory factor X